MSNITVGAINGSVSRNCGLGVLFEFPVLDPMFYFCFCYPYGLVNLVILFENYIETCLIMGLNVRIGVFH